MNLKYVSLMLLAIAALCYACTPKAVEKVTETTTTTPTPPPVEEENLSDCPKFSDAPNPDQALEDFVLYRDFLRAGDWDMAFEKWKKVYEVAPAADGKRNTVFADGITFYEHYIYLEKDALQKEKYIDRIFELYDEIEKCYPKGGYVPGRKAFDYYYNYRDRTTDEEIYSLFKKSIEMDDNKPQYFVINPFTALLIDMYAAGKVSKEEAKKYEQTLRAALAKGLAKCKGSECESWKIIEEYMPSRLEYFESVGDFYDCSYYVEKYYPEFEANPTDCDIIQTVYSRIRFGKCSETIPQRIAIEEAYRSNCQKPTEPSCRDALVEGRYSEAIKCYEEKADETDDKEKKALYLLTIAKIYSSHLKQFSKARQYAQKASAVRPNWGDPYMLIARLYASSGPLCGPGRGWDSQIVTWPAIDMWMKAKSVDSSVAAEANRFINQYSQYMPDRAEIFQRNLKEGDSFRVGCWIQETTTIRAAP